jgi:hypothetical protein
MMVLPESKERRVFNNVLGAMGNTPLVRLERIGRDLPVPLYAKLEFMNPGGSVKDRVGANIIEQAEKRGEIKPGGTIVEATSGNTGVGLAIAAALKGYKTIFVMPDKMSNEKIYCYEPMARRWSSLPLPLVPMTRVLIMKLPRNSRVKRQMPFWRINITTLIIQRLMN